ncbi:MAG: hypothetical protein AB2A00_31900 [Myxococcota bacterium]
MTRTVLGRGGRWALAVFVTALAGASCTPVTCANADGGLAWVGEKWACDCNTCECGPFGLVETTLMECGTDGGP